jgi:hypothetical protein
VKPADSGPFRQGTHLAPFLPERSGRMNANSSDRAALRAVLLAMTILAGCGTSTSPASPSQPADPPAPTPPPPATAYRVTIALVGMDPVSIDVPVGARVTFINKDPNFAHYMASACPEIDAVGRLEPQQSGDTSVFAESKTCKYNDRLSPENPLRMGTIVVR